MNRTKLWLIMIKQGKVKCNNSSVNQQYNVLLSIIVNGQENDSRMVI